MVNEQEINKYLQLSVIGVVFDVTEEKCSIYEINRWGPDFNMKELNVSFAVDVLF